jgi:hypothetical protein
MYDETPTADSAAKYLTVTRWLREKVEAMQDTWLKDFSKAWNAHATGDWDRPPQSLHDETVALERQQKDAAVSVAIPGTSVVLQLDDQGNLTILGGGRAHIEINYALFAAGIAQLPVPASIPDPVQGPPANDASIPGASSGIMSANTPPTNQQLSMRQNELVAQALKAKRR